MSLKGKELMLEDLRSNDKTVKLYTGLPTFLVLKTVFDFVNHNVREHHRSILSNFQQFLMVFMKFHLSFLDQDLAYWL